VNKPAQNQSDATTESQADSRRALAGIFICLALFATLFAGLHPDISSFKAFWPSGVLALIAAVLLLPDTFFAQRIQLGLLVFVGLTLLGIGMINGASMQWSTLLSQNTGMIMMVLSVGIIKLIITDEIVVAEKLPVGRRAYLDTILSVSVFGSVINISAPILIADRLTLNRPMTNFTAGTVVRGFSICALWSPFFAGTAIVLTAVPGIRLLELMMVGFPLFLSGIALLYWGGIFLKREKVEAFPGYPLKPDSLWVPATLALMVFVWNLLAPTVSILVAISLSSLVLTVGVLVLRKGQRRTRASLSNYVTKELPKAVNELQLFLSAGILASGLQAMVAVGWLTSPIVSFTGLTACLLLALIIFVAAMGIHPVIQIAALTPLILTSNPDPELLGLTYMFGWSLGTCGSPLSGTNLVIQGRYSIPAWRSAVQNWPFIGVMYLLACIVLMLQAG